MGVKAIMQENKGFEKPRIPEDIYVVTLKEVKQVRDGKYGQRIAWVCRVLPKPDSKFDGEIELSLVTYNKLSSGNKPSKAMECVEAFGGKFEVGKEFDYDTLVGKNARALIEDYELDDENDKPTGKFASTIAKFKKIGEQ